VAPAGAADEACIHISSIEWNSRINGEPVTCGNLLHEGSAVASEQFSLNPLQADSEKRCFAN
jgi:hypothetical protein